MFYGWYIVAAVFCSQLFITGFMTYCFGLLVLPLQESFDASRADVNLAMSSVTMAGLVLSPVFGALVDRYSPRWLMALGAMAFAGGLAGLSQATTMTQFNVLFGISISASSILLGPLVGSATIARWFSALRGRALGVAAAGTSVGGLILPLLIGHWIDAEGWRAALQNLAWVVAGFLLPLLMLLMRPTPASMGLHPDGVAPPEGEAPPAPAALTLGDIVRRPAFWQIGLCMGLLFASYSALMANLVPHATGTGLDATQATRLMVVIAVTGLLGKLVFGLVADKVNLRLGLACAQALLFSGLLMLLFTSGYSAMLIAASLFGLAVGGMLPVWGALLAQVFGVTSYGKVMGLMNPVITLTIMPTYYLTGLLFDRTGSYDASFMLFCGLLVVSALALLSLREQPVSD